MKAIIYARVSTEEQEKKGYSIEAQLESCRSYARAKGWEVVAEYHEAKSGKRAENREALQKALMFMEEGGADILIVWRLDRLTRSLIDFVKIIERIGPRIASVMEGFDMSTPEGKMLAHILASFAEYEREVISERTKKGLHEAKRAGKKIGRPAKIPMEVRKKILNLRKRGYTYAEIAEKTGIKLNTVKSICHRAGV